MNAVIVCIVGFAAFAIFMLLWRMEDRRAAEEKRGWRLRCVSAGSWAYEEKRAGSWGGFIMSELTDYREPPHHLQIMSQPRWIEYPEWTQGRREEILRRIRSELKEPDYVLKEA
jgi:hypothetical protein